MKGNEFNDLWVILENLEDSVSDLIPDKYKDFVKAVMVPGGESDVDTGIPLEDQTLNENTRDLLACLNLTYLTKDPKSRYEFADRLHRNELAYQGKPYEPMTPEEYQELLQNFDDWNDDFGPIPRWAESRGWEPGICYEVVPEGEKAEVMAGNTGLRSVDVPKDVRDRIREEAKEWVLVADKKGEETLLWHDDDHSTWTGTELIEDFYKRYAVIGDGHFIAALIQTEHTSSYGMAVDRSSNWGILFTDGRTDGETGEHFFHCSTEVDRSEDIQYSLRRKQDANEDN